MTLLTLICAQNTKDKSKVDGVSSKTISCYQCNSKNNSEKDCESNDENVLNKYLKTCSKITDGELTNSSATSCRKIIQNVVDDSAIIRECAYTGEAVDGKRKTGNKGITLYYYQCFNENDGKPCNSANLLNVNFIGIFIACIIYKFNLFARAIDAVLYKRRVDYEILKKCCMGSYINGKKISQKTVIYRSCARDECKSDLYLQLEIYRFPPCIWDKCIFQLY